MSNVVSLPNRAEAEACAEWLEEIIAAVRAGEIACVGAVWMTRDGQSMIGHYLHESADDRDRVAFIGVAHVFSSRVERYTGCDTVED